MKPADCIGRREPVIVGVGLAIVLTLVLRETGTAVRRTA